jgi:cytochrome b6-f complex iron-sulfur subunit
MSNKNNSSSKVQNQVPKKPIVSRSEAGRRLDRFQAFIGISLIISAAFGSYLLATDKSLWILAVSHAYGLLAICIIDLILGALNFLSVRRVLFPTLGWAILTMLLQLGDIATAPQFGMKIPYFARYLFGLWAFDGILLVQGVIIVVGLSGRSYQRLVAKKRKPQTYFDMGLKSSRRDFLQIGGTIGAFLVLAAALGIWTTLTPSENLPSPSSTGGNSSSTLTSSLPSGSIANIKDLQVGIPKYFDYPSAGYTNMLMRKADGTVSALSILCTHVCCQCQYDSTTTDLYCPCHGSEFDQNGNVLRGPASTKLPSIQLNMDSNGNIFPIKVVGSGPCVSG